MGKYKRITKAEKERNQIIERHTRIERNKKSGHHHKYEFTENDTSWNELKAMYDNRIEKYNVLLGDYLKLLESTKRTALNNESQTMKYYLEIIRSIIINCHKENEIDIIRRIVRQRKKYKAHSTDERREINNFNKWRKSNREKYNDFFKEICLEEYNMGNIDSLQNITLEWVLLRST